MTSQFKFGRFLTAQDPVIDEVRAELQAGHKITHWMWFIFPQLRGLGQSDMSERYAISSVNEARAYLDHPILGARLFECTTLIIQISGSTAEQIFGFPDNLKFHSSMTLFSAAKSGRSVFSDALDMYFEGIADSLTVKILSEAK